MDGKGDWHLTAGVKHERGRGDPFAAAIRATRMPMVITDPRRPDNPIIFVNDAFLAMTGYRRDEAMGRNCRFLQGSGTDRDAIGRLRAAVAAETDVEVSLLNYRKDGTTFWNSLYLSPVRSDAGEVQFFFASQLDITARVEHEAGVREQQTRTEREVDARTRELRDAVAAKDLLLHEVDHRVKNNLQMVSSLISLQARRTADEAVRTSLRSMRQRVDALSAVHRRLHQADAVGRLDTADLLRDIATELVGATGRGKVGLRLRLEPIEVPTVKAAPLALMVNELVANVLAHAFPDGRPGRLTITTARLDGGFSIVVEDDGVGLPPERPRGALGHVLIDNFARQLGAEVHRSSVGPGTRVSVEIPNEQERAS